YGQLRIEPIQPIEDRQRLVGGGAAVEGGVKQPARLHAFAAAERLDAVLQQFFGFALSLGQGAAGALDVGAGAGMAAIEEEDARPDVDRVVVLRGEVMIEAGEQQLLDLGVTIRARRDLERPYAVG